MIDAITPEEKEKILKSKADAHFVLQNQVHITLKNGRFARGLITRVEDGFFILEEVMDGRQAVTFAEIINIEKRRER